MNKRLKEKIEEALSSVVPITAIVLLLSFTMAPMPVSSLMLFLVGALLLIVGVGLFSLGGSFHCALSSACLSPLPSRT